MDSSNASKKKWETVMSTVSSQGKKTLNRFHEYIFRATNRVLVAGSSTTVWKCNLISAVNPSFALCKTHIHLRCSLRFIYWMKAHSADESWLSNQKQLGHTRQTLRRERPLSGSCLCSTNRYLWGSLLIDCASSLNAQNRETFPLAPLFQHLRTTPFFNLFPLV